MERNPGGGVEDARVGQNTEKTAKITIVLLWASAISLAERHSVKCEKQESQPDAGNKWDTGYEKWSYLLPNVHEGGGGGGWGVGVVVVLQRDRPITSRK